MAVDPNTIGKVSGKVKKTVIWKINGGCNFYNLQDVYESPTFYFAGVEWVMKLERDCIKYFIELSERSRVQDLGEINCTMYKKVEIEVPCDVHRSIDGFKTDNPVINMRKLKSRHRTLTIKCFLQIEDVPDSNTGTAECSYCKRMVNADTIASHQKYCGLRPVICPICFKRFLLMEDHECQYTEETTGELMEYLYRLLLEKNNSKKINRLGIEIQNESGD